MVVIISILTVIRPMWHILTARSILLIVVLLLVQVLTLVLVVAILEDREDDVITTPILVRRSM